ncbi:a-glycosyltransferase-related protein, glycosyltransferase family 4 protein [Cytophaga hutchinsonii ATCC 33406]|uniref:A-glycosyltransferase-related protein, glycosyltransferase family 4 protein n=2 Tax=Cytophaga hutchinsonii TaxID=985 RepID=A0A6N4SUN1_CYTH3|nr:a-glycosyltransferase-related protein, glycosyltransferase family 4 protein [Cytophaga hutchinsonii ATCC 33406]
MMRSTIVVSVTTDLVTDQRVYKVCNSLYTNGYTILLVGRKKKDSMVMDKRPYKTHRFNLWFEKGPLFYAQYNLYLFFYLLFHKADIYLANDLDTLLPNYLVSKIKGVPLAYDNHEYFTGVPELIKRPKIQKIWKSIENWIFPKVKYIYTDNFAKRSLFVEEFKQPVEVVMNVPILQETPVDARYRLEGVENKFILIYQGTGINVARGTEELTLAMKYLDERFLLLFVGSGDVIDVLKALVKEHALENKVRFVPKVPHHVLKQYTMQAHLGITVDKPISENYIYSFPNKVFDYVHAGVPVLASRLQEVERIMNLYGIGTFVDSYEPEHIAARIQWIHDNPEQYAVWKENLVHAAKEINWQQQEKILLGIYQRIKEENGL